MKVVFFHPTEFQNVFFGFFVDHIDHVIVGNNPDQPSIIIHHRGRGQTLVSEDGCHFFLIHGCRNGVGFF